MASVIALLLARLVVAAPPSAIGHLTNLTRAPNSQEKAQIDAYAGYWTTRLGGEDPVEVGEGYSYLKQPLEAPGITKVFRVAYSDSLIDRLKPIVAQPKAHQGAANALQICGLLGTEAALEVIQRHLDSQLEARAAIRLMAAKAFRQCMEIGQREDLIPARRAGPALRKMEQAIRNEDVWWVMIRQFEALLATTHVNMPAVRNDAFDAVVARLAKEQNPTPVVRALRPVIVDMRNEFFDARMDPQLGRAYAKRLGQVLSLIGRHWPDRQKEPGLWQSYQSLIRICENNLSFVDSNLRGGIGPTKFLGPFEAGDREAFQQELQRIEKILQRPPYQ